MTRFFVDNKEIQPPGNATSVSQILRYVEDAHLAKNAVIKQVQVNGVPLALESFSAAEEYATPGPIQTADKVEIITGNIAEIARGSISEALDYLDRIESVTPSLAKSFRTNPAPESLDSLRQLYEGFYWLHLLLNKLELDFNIHHDDASVQRESEHEYCRRFVSTLRRLMDSQEKGDFVRVADLLEREILPFVPLWRELLSAVAQEAGVTR